jgi:DNA-binding FadR family transcriptional regulator
MATVSNYALRLPNSLMTEVKQAAEKDATTINQFITVAVARRLAELKTTEYFAERAAKADPTAFAKILNRAGSKSPVEGDEVPEGWLESR